MKELNPNKKLETVIKGSDLPSLTKDYAEVALDSFLEDGVLKDIPGVGSVIGLVKFGSSINKHIAAKKLYKFLFELREIPQDKREQKIKQLNESKKYQSNVGETIFELLEKIESDFKPEILGRIFKAVIEERIDYETYLRIGFVLKSIFYYDLIEFKKSMYWEDVMLSSDFSGLSYKLWYSMRTSGIIVSSKEQVFKRHSEFIDDGMNKKQFETLTEMGSVLIGIGMKDLVK